MHAHARRALSLASVILVIAGWFALVGPTPLGGPATYVAVSGKSMEPTLVEGDLAIARRSDTYRPGDVVVFRVPAGEPAAGGLVIHRIIGGSAAGYIVQGDNKPAPDSWRPTAADIDGALWLRVPGAANAVIALRQPGLSAAVAAALAAFVVMSAGSLPVRQPAPRSVEPVGGSDPDRYRWTRDRGLAVCGGDAARVGAPSRPQPSPLVPDAASAAPFRWTVSRGRAVCRTGPVPRRAAAVEG